MSNITTGVSYGASGVSGGYWMLQLLDTVSPTQWAALGVLSSLVFGLLTFLTNLYFKIREEKKRGVNNVKSKQTQCCNTGAYCCWRISTCHDGAIPD
ncbi:MAG: class II holin family protein [Symbiopectobacterium sp.]|uniref:class II holin family protein n=1 Tax=Symbiopectobacterium sp. TaxID=2952789 RepID=UPI003F3D0CEE